ncbi:efflux RND transporter periplasmic adaptor subunit [Aliikangiella coralliicola]|uniref:Efflux RND transporter periplasmic adaptor subunit n=1 Tax=Aliikangiella coralliicola TaxID=2592383 RepID=A0A545UHA6_9GAMM|nr:efflux RND transporter periplasmic adaptor subunit [Aliikangiella coralliicola]TQV88854.1 efflux RND transporter periplasmic adaptor subunit [Aliikangiella coralliicola]
MIQTSKLIQKDKLVQKSKSIQTSHTIQILEMMSDFVKSDTSNLVRHRKTKLVTRQFSKLAILVLGLSYFWGSVNAAEQAPRPVQVKPVKAMEQQPTADILGTIYSRNQVQLTAGVDGKLEWVAEPGTYVKKGDLIAQVELLPLQLKQAEQTAQLKRAKINLQYLERELKRQRELRKKNSASQYQLEQTQSQSELAQSDLEIAELRLKQINDQLSRAAIRSPFEGVVTERVRRAGYDVGRSDVLVNLLDTESLEVRLFVPVKHLAFTKPGSEVVLSSRSENGETFQVKARAKTIIPAADPRSQTFEMRINVPEEGKNFWAAGQLIKVSLPIESIRAAITVHRDALILRRDGTYVVKIDNENKAHRLKVRVGKGQGDWVTVQGDLKQGDQVATRGAERLQDGQIVVVQSAGS